MILEKRVSRFYLYIWLEWALRLTFSSLFFALLLAVLISFSLYLWQGMLPFTQELQKALFDITKFWFFMLWNLTLLLFLFRTLKSVFNNCKNGYKLQLHSCPKENDSHVIHEIGYGDLLGVWRKWFMLLIWLVAGEMIVTLGLSYIFSYESIFDWFNIYILYSFILFAGYFSFMILSTRCKRVKLVKC